LEAVEVLKIYMWTGLTETIKFTCAVISGIESPLKVHEFFLPICGNAVVNF